MNFLKARAVECKKNYNGRKVAIWGNGVFVNRLITYLRQEGIVIDIMIDSEANKSGGAFAEIKEPSFLEKKADEYYVVVGCVNEYEEIINLLHRYGYLERDYTYIRPFSKNMESIGDNVYEDEYGNIIYGDLQGIRVNFLGYFAEIRIDGKISNGGSEIVMGTEARLQIGDGVVFRNGIPSLFNIACIIKVYERAFLSIGRGTTFGGNNLIHIYRDLECVIGEDCMFSDSTVVRSWDGHNIFDIQTGKQTNVPTKERYNIVIDEHVWVGERAIIIHGVHIGMGSIVGENAFVNRDVPSNSIAAGTPATIVKKGVAWARFTNEGFEDIPSKYK